MPPDTLSLNQAPSVHVNDLVAEGLIDLAAAAGDCKDASGRKPHLATLRRWAKHGCRGHRLETVFLGNRLMTSHQAMRRFLAAINGGPILPSTATTSEAERAGRELDSLLR